MLQLRRLNALSRDHELVGDDGQALAQVRLRALREAGEIHTSDGRRWTVRRDPNFGPWRVTDDGGALLVTVTKEGLRERLTVEWPAGGLRLERRSNFGRRHLEVLDVASGAKVGEIRQSGWTGRTVELDLPIAPDEVIGAIAWTVAMLGERDAAAVAAQN